MKILLLGHGKTGSVVGQVALERGHRVTVLTDIENLNAVALTPDTLRDVEVAIDFTDPQAVLGNMGPILRAGKPLVVGTTGWYSELPRVGELVQQTNGSLLYGANFSLGVNLFFGIARAAAAAFKHGYQGHITETHHAQKKDAPSGTAVMLQRTLEQAGAPQVPISSIREGDVVGRHVLELDCAADTITLAHDGKSRLGFAQGAVRAAEWLPGHRGLFNFSDIFDQL